MNMWTTYNYHKKNSSPCSQIAHIARVKDKSQMGKKQYILQLCVSLRNTPSIFKIFCFKPAPLNESAQKEAWKEIINIHCTISYFVRITDAFKKVYWIQIDSTRLNDGFKTKICRECPNTQIKQEGGIWELWQSPRTDQFDPFSSSMRLRKIRVEMIGLAQMRYFVSRI